MTNRWKFNGFSCNRFRNIFNFKIYLNFVSRFRYFFLDSLGELTIRRGRGRGRGRRNNKGGDCDTPRSANKRGGNRQSGIGSTASLQSSSNSPLKGKLSMLTSVYSSLNIMEMMKFKIQKIVFQLFNLNL